MLASPRRLLSFARLAAVRTGRQLARLPGTAALLGIPAGIRSSSAPPLHELPLARPLSKARVYDLQSPRLRGVHGHYQVAVLDQANRLIPELSPDVHPVHLHRAFAEPLFHTPSYVHPTAVCLATPGARNNYFHWLIELLPKFCQLEQAGLELEAAVPIFLAHAQLPYQAETLAYFGVDIGRVHNLGPKSHFRLDHLIMPSHQPNHLETPEWAVSYLRAKLLPEADPGIGPTKLFVDRGRARRRRLLNNDAVRNHLETVGFTAVDLAELPVSRQIQLFRDARVIAGTHGAGFSNIVFCEPGTQLIEFFPPSYQPDYFRNLASIVGVKWHSVVGDPARRNESRGVRLSLEEPFSLPIDRLEQLGLTT